MIEFLASQFPMVFGLVVTGFFAGILAGLLGVGGGIVNVPVLFFLFQSAGVSPETAMLVATATSLATIVPTSISSIRSHHRTGNVDVALLKSWWGFILTGVLLGSWLVMVIDGVWLAVLFGFIAILSVLNMLFRPAKSALFQRLPGKFGQIVMGGSIGCFSSMVGIGGGTITVPLLTFYNYPAHRAVGTAAAIGLIISLPGALTMLLLASTPSDAPYSTYGLVNLIAFLFIIPLTVIFAPLGVSIATKLDTVKLKRVFAVVLLITGLRMLSQIIL